MPLKLDIQHNFKPSAKRFGLPNKLLVGAGPTNCSPRVVSALAKCTLGVICEELYEMMDDIQEISRYVFQTTNGVTLVLQNSGSGGIEAALANVVDPGEKIVVVVGGVWGDRIANIAKTRNIDVVKIDLKDGEVLTPKDLEEEIIKQEPVLVFITHGEPSGGTLQPLEGLGDICHKHNCLLAVDAAATLGGIPFFTDRWGVDVAVSGSQYAIGAPPGMSLLTLSPKAVERMKATKTPPAFYYNLLRLCEVWNCFGSRRRFHRYHYTFNSHMLCALREALVELAEEGLDKAWVRHAKAASRFWQGMEIIELKHFVKKPENRLSSFHLICIPSGIKWDFLLDYFSEKYQVAMGSGTGPSLNKAALVGIMGYNARPEVVDYVLKLLDDGLNLAKVQLNNEKLGKPTFSLATFTFKSKIMWQQNFI